eukprot:5232752-Amphidinium_carterae.1
MNATYQVYFRRTELQMQHLQQFLASAMGANYGKTALLSLVSCIDFHGCRLRTYSWWKRGATDKCSAGKWAWYDKDALNLLRGLDMGKLFLGRKNSIGFDADGTPISQAQSGASPASDLYSDAFTLENPQDEPCAVAESFCFLEVDNLAR